MIQYHEHYVIRGDTGMEYDVRYQNGRWSCTCPHWTYRLRKTGGQCKHISLAKVHDLLMDHLQSSFEGLDFTLPDPRDIKKLEEDESDA